MLYPPLLRFLLFLLVLMTLSTLSDNLLNLNLLLVLLLVLLHYLYVLRPPVQPPISAGIIANMGIKLNTAELLAHGSGKLTGRQEVHALSVGDSNLFFWLEISR